MNREELIMFCCSDIAGQVRGKGFPAQDLPSRLRQGVGWTPTNVMITAFGDIPPGRWGPFGDLFLVPDPETEVHVYFADELPGEHFFLGNIVHTDGKPWECCLRAFLKNALDDLERQAGVRLLAAFEHEFHYSGVDGQPATSYGLDAMRQQGVFGEIFVHAMRRAGLVPDTLLAEYGPGQYEATCAPTLGVRAADQAVILREMARAAAHRLGHRVSFSPMVTRGIVGNGTHVHMSLRDDDDRPVTYDPAGPGGLSQVAGRFVAGVLRHARALCALTAPSCVSYERLVPHSWSAAWNNVGLRDREACVRICPYREGPGHNVAAQFNVEYRAADAAASPYLLLGALVRAGLQGIRDELPLPDPTTGDPGEMTTQERERRGIARLPQSLEEALEALEADDLARAWFPPELLDAYLRHKRGEIEAVRDLTRDEQCRRYRAAY